ncbi:hypothetical protein CALVIDRAFT_538326 [Calocera viscosa TUFC12733]|uniref:GDP/GTP exchange factor Sec2 N-terminal domain-containing protein n=1 Tax=Calocera viscosa (strain TUFC12733) TaxID=1330018 RepID=A0A167KZP5_CALVF|nr:hypothetical protein CALVIDRAFT_538326 [Calocera viscosa TUFC12733]
MEEVEHQEVPSLEDVDAKHEDIPGGFEEPEEAAAPPAEPVVVEEPTTEEQPVEDLKPLEAADESKPVETVQEATVNHAAVQVDEESLALTEPKQLGDPDEPHLLVIESLRAQTADLISQVTQLNAKLVKSYDRVSDLEDDIHVSSQNLRAAKLKVTALELERSEHLSALNTGLLVERENVTMELKSMMERVSEEAAQRGEAVSAKEAIEKDLDDLSATLFFQANSMVAEARLDRARSARRAAECEEALKGAEEAMTMVQKQMQDLREEKEKSDREMERMKEVMGKGKYVEKEKEVVILPLRLMNSHLPYKEFMDFISHLRGIRPTTQSPPPIHTLLTLPFLARLITEDTDSTVRFDLAPSLNWLTRRSFTTAIQQGLLLIEPLHTSSLQAESASILTFSSASEVLCGLCGCPVFGHQSRTPGAASSFSAPSSYRPAQVTANTTSSWSTSRFLKSNPLAALNNTRGSLPNGTSLTTPPPTPLPEAIIHVFRLSTPPSQKPASPYPLCQSGWCLTRLRTTCELWGFVRRGVIDHVWEDDIPTNTTPPPVVPPRKRMTSRMGFWGMGSSDSVSALMAPSASAPGATGDVKPPLPPRRHSEQPSAAPATPPRRRVPPPPKFDVVETPPTPSPTSNGDAEKVVLVTDDATPHLSEEPEGVEATAETQEVKEAVTDGDDVVIKLEPPMEPEESVPAESKPANGSAEPKAEDDAADKPTVNGDHPSTPPRSADTESPTTPMSAPPPIPRRAAARSRATPTTPTGATPGGSPAKMASQLPPSSPEQNPVASSAVEITPPRVTSDAENEDFLSAPSSPKSKPTSPTERDMPPLDIPAPEYKEEGSSPTVNGVTEHIPEISPISPAVNEKARVPPPMPPRRAAPPKIADLPVPVSPIALPEEVGFTNDASWEEKAWRELVRLREDMFLTRIGAVRADPASLMGTA